MERCGNERRILDVDEFRESEGSAEVSWEGGREMNSGMNSKDRQHILTLSDFKAPH